MRTYPRNSPHAAARIVTLAMLADGHLCRTELDVLDRLDAHRQLGLDPAAMHAVIHGLCEDLLATSVLTWSQSCQVDPATLAQLMAEIDDAALRRTVLHLCTSVFEADRHVAEGECVVLGAAIAQWGLQHEPLPAAA